MTQNSNAIITLCSHICVGENVSPLEPKEWSALAKKLMDAQLQPEDLFRLSRQDLIQSACIAPEQADRIQRLLDRNASLMFELSQLENMGILAITRADHEYPAKLKQKLGNHCPPIFYCAGNFALLNHALIGYVGSRTVGPKDIDFTEQAVKKTISQGYGVVSGGAKGIDSVAEETALATGASVVEYLSDSMLHKLRSAKVTKAIREGALLLLSVTKPDAGFNVGTAMLRNRFIYIQSCGTVVVKSDFQKGGTWAGAVENIKHNWCKTFCWDQTSYKGNRALIQAGAIAIKEDWNGDPTTLQPTVAEQISMFD